MPLETKAKCVALGVTNATALVPLPRITLWAVREAAPVPPLTTFKTPVTLLAKSDTGETVSKLTPSDMNK